MKKISKIKNNTDGQSLVEFALVLPFLIFLILGMVEFGWILNGKITLTSAAREGARAAVTRETQTDAETAAKNAVSKSVESSSLNNVNATITKFDVPTKEAVVTVTAKITPIIGLYFPDGDVTVTAKAEMRIE